MLLAHQNLYFGEREKKDIIIEGRNVKEDIEKAKDQVSRIRSLANMVENTVFMNNIISIANTSTKIIQTIENEPKKIRKVDSFFDYYLPVTINIITRYDEIENQRLVSADSKMFMEKSRQIIAQLDVALQNLLASLYQNDIVNTEADLKVLDMMMKAEGLNSESLNVDKK